MEKDGIIGRQKLDSNCNDCKFMVRNIEAFNESLEFHKELQLKAFEAEKERLNKLVNKFYREQKFDDGFAAEKKLQKMKFQFDKKDITINYGQCTKLKKAVSFIPNVCQIETQECFEHRRC